MTDLRIHATAEIHESAMIDPSSVVDAACRIGADTKIWHFCHVLRDTSIGADCVLGQNVMAGPLVQIGDGCRLQNNVSVFEGVTLEEDVFCGPSCVFTNVLNPRAFYPQKDAFRTTLVRKGVSIGANATIVCGVTIGEYAMIGAGAVVTKDVKDHELVYGTPARHQGWVSRIGQRLDADLVCPVSKEHYSEMETGLVPLR